MNIDNKDFKQLLMRSASNDLREMQDAQYKVAKALTVPVREAILSGDILTGHNIFEKMLWANNEQVEFPLDILAPGEEDDLVAYTNPGDGRIPEAQLEGSYVTIPTYKIAGAIDWLLDVAAAGDTWMLSRYIEVLKHQFVKKINDDGWHTIIAGATDRNIMVYDADADAGQFTKRLVSLTKVAVARNGGGNSGSMGRRKLTDIFLSLEGIEDIRNWGVDQIDEITRRELFTMEDGAIKRIFGVNLHEMYELGPNHEYQDFFTNVLGGSVQTSDLELAIGLDLSNKTSFVMPVKQEVQFFPDPDLHRSQKQGYYGWGKLGFASLDNRNSILMSY